MFLFLKSLKLLPHFHDLRFSSKFVVIRLQAKLSVLIFDWNSHSNLFFGFLQRHPLLYFFCPFSLLLLLHLLLHHFVHFFFFYKRKYID